MLSDANKITTTLLQMILNPAMFRAIVYPYATHVIYIVYLGSIYIKFESKYVFI